MPAAAAAGRALQRTTAVCCGLQCRRPAMCGQQTTWMYLHKPCTCQPGTRSMSAQSQHCAAGCVCAWAETLQVVKERRHDLLDWLDDSACTWAGRGSVCLTCAGAGAAVLHHGPLLRCPRRRCDTLWTPLSDSFGRAVVQRCTILQGAAVRCAATMTRQIASECAQQARWCVADDALLCPSTSTLPPHSREVQKTELNKVRSAPATSLTCSEHTASFLALCSKLFANVQPSSCHAARAHHLSAAAARPAPLRPASQRTLTDSRSNNSHH